MRTVTIQKGNADHMGYVLCRNGLVCGAWGTEEPVHSDRRTKDFQKWWTYTELKGIQDGCQVKSTLEQGER